MRIKLRFFGQLRDLTKANELDLEIDDHPQVGDLVQIIGERYPTVRKHLQVVSFAVNNEYARKEQKLNEGDEVGLLPPISGGSHG